MKLKVALIVASLSLPTTLAATITLYAVSYSNTAPTPTISLPMPSLTIHAIGTDSNGQTTYAQDEIESVLVIEKIPHKGGFYTTNGVVTTSTVSTEALTYTTGPLTLHWTLVDDATRYVYHKEPEPSGDYLRNVGLHEECVFDGKGAVSCVEESWLDAKNAGTTTMSWTGSMIVDGS